SPFSNASYIPRMVSTFFCDIAASSFSLRRHHRQRPRLRMGKIEMSLVGIGSLVIQLIESVLVLKKDRLTLDADGQGPRHDIRYSHRLVRVAAEEIGRLESAPVRESQS